MIGKHFIEVVEGRMINQGVVMQKLDEAHYLLLFASQNGPPLQRVVPTARMLALLLFNSIEEVQDWIQANSDQTALQQELPGIEPGLPDELIVPAQPAAVPEAADVGGE